MTRAYARRILILLAALGTACGGSSTSPSPAAIAIAGEWSGTWQFVTSGVTVTDNVHVTFTHADTATGTWTSDSGATGQFQFAVGPTVSGTFTISQPNLNGNTCAAIATLTGSVSANAMTLSVLNIASTALCSWATNNQFSLHR